MVSGAGTSSVEKVLVAWASTVVGAKKRRSQTAWLDQPMAFIGIGGRCSHDVGADRPQG